MKTISCFIFVVCFLLMSNNLIAGTPSSKVTNKWRGGVVGKSEMDDSRIVTFSLPAINKISGWLTVKQPVLVLRCAEKRFDIYIITGMPAQIEYGYGYDGAPVEIRLDSDKLFKEKWGESTDNDALFAHQSYRLAKQLLGKRLMLFKFTPFNANEAIIKFDLTGFDEKYEYLKQVCTDINFDD